MKTLVLAVALLLSGCADLAKPAYCNGTLCRASVDAQKEFNACLTKGRLISKCMRDV